jgi:hypothetical protein
MSLEYGMPMGGLEWLWARAATLAEVRKERRVIGSGTAPI